MKADVPMFMQGPDYPFELMHNAAYLAKLAASENASHEPHPVSTIRHPNVRALSRAAIMTACNCVESLLMNLVQGYLAKQVTKTPAQLGMGETIRQRKANISWTMEEWPLALTGIDVYHSPEFAEFLPIFRLRNDLMHPKLEGYGIALAPSHDDLLQAANEAKAQWVVEECSKMAKALYTAFGERVDQIFLNPMG